MYTAIKRAQTRIWQALKAKPDGLQVTTSFESTQKVLEKFAESKVTLVVLHIDLVESTRLSMTLPADRLAIIIQSFYQEISDIISAYGGYVLKYVGDAVIAFFVVPADLSNISSINAVNCAKSMIKIIQQGINPILNQYDYPEINVRIGIDVGESTVKLTGWDTYHTGTNDSYKNGNKSKSNGNHENIFGHDNSRKGVPIIKKPIYDIIGYTVNIATKMTAFAKPNQVVIGQLVYDALDNTQKSTFKRIYIDPKVWDYVSESTGVVFIVYMAVFDYYVNRSLIYTSVNYFELFLIDENNLYS